MFTKVKKTHYEIFIFSLSIYALLELSIEFVTQFPLYLSKLTTDIDIVVSIIFFADWLYFFIKAPCKRTHFFTHVFDLLSSVPFVPKLRIFRLFRIFRFIRGFKGIISLWKIANRKPMESALSAYLIYMAMIFMYCSLAFYKYEFLVNKELKSFSDVLWLSFTTLTTIGYGDIYPVTNEGRVVAAILVVTGAGFFALLCGEFATILLKATRNEAEKQ